MANDTQNPNPPEEQPSGVPSGNRGDTVRASWYVSLDDLRKAVSNSSEHAQELIVWCYLWCIDDAHPVSLAEFSERVAVDKTTIGRIIRGSYTHPESGSRLPISDKLVRAMELFRKMEQERARATDTGFVPTPTAKRIWTACDLARESQSPVFIVGPSHIGKTKALIAYKEENNHGHTVYVRLQAASGLGGMVRRIASTDFTRSVMGLRTSPPASITVTPGITIATSPKRAMRPRTSSTYHASRRSSSPMITVRSPRLSSAQRLNAPATPRFSGSRTSSMSWPSERRRSTTAAAAGTGDPSSTTVTSTPSRRAATTERSACSR